MIMRIESENFDFYRISIQSGQFFLQPFIIIIIDTIKVDKWANPIQ